MGLLVVVLVFPFSSAFAQQPNRERNREVFFRLVDEVNAGNIDVLSDIFAPEFVSHSPYGEGNRDSWIATIAAYRAAMPDLVLTPQPVIAEGDFVVSVILFEGTFANPLSMPTARFLLDQLVLFEKQSIHASIMMTNLEEWLTWDK